MKSLRTCLRQWLQTRLTLTGRYSPKSITGTRPPVLNNYRDIIIPRWWQLPIPHQITRRKNPIENNYRDRINDRCATIPLQHQTIIKTPTTRPQLYSRAINISMSTKAVATAIQNKFPSPAD